MLFQDKQVLEAVFGIEKRNGMECFFVIDVRDFPGNKKSSNYKKLLLNLLTIFCAPRATYVEKYISCTVICTTTLKIIVQCEMSEKGDSRKTSKP